MSDTTFHIEVVKRRESRRSKNYIIDLVQVFIQNEHISLRQGLIIHERDLEDGDLKSNVMSIIICDFVQRREEIPTSTRLLLDCKVVYYVYSFNNIGSEMATAPGEGSSEDIQMADAVWTLPTGEFHGLWESLIYDSKIKQETLQYVETAFEFNGQHVNSNIVGCNRVVLLHGPPGTGKTSLCRALAQKLSIRLADRFPRARLFEIKSHGHFSKGFSERAQRVAKAIDHIRQMAEDERMLACILVDGIDSVVQARHAAEAGSEPSDSICVVNAILTRLKSHPNVLVLTTSNVTGAIDGAFVDRADIKCLVGLPSAGAAYDILRRCCEELMLRGIIAPTDTLFNLDKLEFMSIANIKPSFLLRGLACSAASAKLSARALCRLPFMARALFPTRETTLLGFIDSLKSAFDKYTQETENSTDENAE